MKPSAPLSLLKHLKAGRTPSLGSARPLLDPGLTSFGRIPHDFAATLA